MKTETIQYLIIVVLTIISIILLKRQNKHKIKIEQLKKYGEKCRLDLTCSEQKIIMFKREIKTINKENQEYKSVNKIQKQRLKDLRTCRYINLKLENDLQAMYGIDRLNEILNKNK